MEVCKHNIFDVSKRDLRCVQNKVRFKICLHLSFQNQHSFVPWIVHQYYDPCFRSRHNWILSLLSKIFNVTSPFQPNTHKNINIFIFIHYPFQPYTHLNASLMGQQALVAATSPSAYISQVWIDYVILFFHHHHHCPRHRHHHHHHQHWHRPPQQMTAGLPTMAHSGTNPGINGLASTIVTPTSGLPLW